MSAIANLVAYDGATTPVLHTLVPISVTKDKGTVTAEWREQLTAVPLYAQPWAKSTLTRLGSGVWKSTLKTGIPFMEAVVGGTGLGYQAAPKVAYTNTMETSSFSSERGDIAGRSLARGMHANLLAGRTSSYVLPLSGNVAEQFDQLVAPS